MTLRRLWVLSLILITILFLAHSVTQGLMPQERSAMGWLASMFYIGLTPWLAIGFWSSLIGMLLLRVSKDPLSAVFPQAMVQAARAKLETPLTGSTALLICIRHEDTQPIVDRLGLMIEDLNQSGHAQHFHLYVLSDSSDPEKLDVEAKAIGALQSQSGHVLPITYRVRATREGYKAGNVMEFCERYGAQHALAITLDADSYMGSESLTRLVRMMESDPQLGILQGLVIGLPSVSPFTRLFQFGMRLGMRAWTFGNAWWQSDCGPYWGHNAAFRIAPFTQHCKLPLLPPNASGPRHILSHDQVEAALMRRAGFAVRVYPLEDKSFEQNPPNLTEFIRRDLRWCEGNLQYFPLLGMTGLHLISRIQLIYAILMFATAPAWIGLILWGTWAACSSTLRQGMDEGALLHLFQITLLMFYVPKLASILGVLLNTRERQGFGGGIRFLTSVLLELLFSVLLSPIMWLSQTLFIAQLLSGGSKGWSASSREGYAIDLSMSVKQFWPHTLMGVSCLALVGTYHPQGLGYALFYVAGLALAIPLSMLTANDRLGQWMKKWGLAQLPEELAPPPELLALNALETTKQPEPFNSIEPSPPMPTKRQSANTR
jgi:membrane glycosyltransferase